MASTNPATRFEPSDLSVRSTALVGAGIFAGVLIVCGLVFVAFWYYAHYRAEVSDMPTPAESGYRPVPPEPRLQPNPAADFQTYRASEEAQLNNYGWVDRKNGIVRIPIERAMELLASRGIPPQKAPADLKLYPPHAGTRLTGFEGKVVPEQQ